MKSIAWQTVAQLVSIFLFGTIAMLLLADFVPFMQPMPFGWRLAVGMLTGAIVVARSPSSAIAIVTELRAKGLFTRTVLGVTVLMDVVVVVCFAGWRRSG